MAEAAEGGPFELIVGGDILYREQVGTSAHLARPRRLLPSPHLARSRPQVVQPLLSAVRALATPAATTVLLSASLQVPSRPDLPSISPCSPFMTSSHPRPARLSAPPQHSPSTMRAFVAAASAAGFEVRVLGPEAQSPQWRSPEVRLIQLTLPGT